jgi:hypothetical protein
VTSESLKRSEKGLHSRIISVGPVMKPHLKSLIAPIVLSSACFLLQPLRPATQVRVVSKEEEKHEAWLRDRLREARSIKAGVSKADLLKVFTPDGGLQPIPPERYVLRTCPYIKVDVQFQLPGKRPLAKVPPDSELRS